MTRGAIIPLSPAEVVARALSLCVVPDDRQARIWYSCERGRNGGDDPTANTCASIWRDRGDGGRIWCTADCVGFACWAAGIDRYQPARCVSYAGWVNQNSMLMEARSGRPGALFHWLHSPRLGCFAVLGTEGRRVGHVGIVVELGDAGPRVAHCSPANHKRVDQAIAVTSEADAFGSRVGAVAYLEMTSVSVGPAAVG